MRPKCPECEAELVFEDPYWFCEACDLEFMPDDLGMEDENEET